MKFFYATIFEILFLIASAEDFTNFDTRNGFNEEGALLNHLKTTEALVQQLLKRVEQIDARNEAQQQTIWNHVGRIEQLEARDKDQQQLILNLRSELAVQRQRTDSLERICKVTTQSEGKEKGISKTLNTLGNDRPTQSTSVVTNKAYVEENGPDEHKVLGYDMHKTQSRIRRADNGESIAFFATLTHHLQNAGVQQTFVFDRVVSNLGNGYNSHTGIFIAPVSGTYVFSATLISLYHISAHSQFTKNGQPVSRMYVSGRNSGYDTTSQTIVVQLLKNDDVCIRKTNPNTYHGDHYSTFTDSTFSGFMLQQDFSIPAVVGKK